MAGNLKSQATIESTAEVCGGKPRIAGTRIRVQDVATWTEHWGYSPDEIVFHFPHLTLAGVHAALSYFYEHRDEIQRDIEAGDKLADELRAKSPSILLSKLTG